MSVDPQVVSARPYAGFPLQTAWVPGLFLCLCAAVVAMLVGKTTGAPAPFLALTFGLLGSTVGRRPHYSPGVSLTGKTLLRIGVALLGVRISAPKLIEIGATANLVAVASLVICLTSGLIVGKVLRIETWKSLISVGAVSICGASAALALAATQPASDERDRHASFTVAAVTLLSTAAMVGYPALAWLWHLTSMQAGTFFGSTIHDLTQVVGAGAALSPQAFDYATVTKLARIACLLPVVSLSVWVSRGGKRTEMQRSATIFPGFLIGFFALAVASGLDLFPLPLSASLTHLSELLLLMATAALGFGTRLRSLFDQGWKPLLLILVQTFVIGLVGLGLSATFVN